MIGKRLEDVTIDDIKLLIVNQVQEDRLIDYKQTLSGGSDKDKKEFLADVSSFANTSGGYIIYGIKEDCGRPIEIIGVESSNIDGLIRVFGSTIESGLDPRIQYEIKPIHLSGNCYIILIYIHESWIKPHRISFQHDSKFFGRNSAGKYIMDTTELRRIFLTSSIVEERIKNFHSERIDVIESGNGPHRLEHSPKIILHIIPFESLANRVNINVNRIPNDSFKLLLSSGQSWRLNLDGKLFYTGYNKPITESYVQVFRNGIVEAVDNQLLIDPYNEANDLSIPSQLMEQELSGVIDLYINTLKSLGLNFPYYIYLSLMNIKGYRLAVRRRPFGEQYNFQHRSMHLPEVVINDQSVPIVKAMKPIYDVFWNAFNYPWSLNYNDAGDWVGQ